MYGCRTELGVDSLVMLDSLGSVSSSRPLEGPPSSFLLDAVMSHFLNEAFSTFNKE